MKVTPGAGSLGIPFHIDYSARLLVVYVPAHATTQDILENIEIIAREPDFTDFDVMTIFSDLNRVVGDMSAFQNDLRSVSDKLIERYGTGGKFKAAYVISKNVDFGLLRMFTTYRGRKLEHTELFYDAGEALEWLGIGESDRSAMLQTIKALQDDKPRS